MKVLAQLARPSAAILSVFVSLALVCLALVFPKLTSATILFADDFELSGWTPTSAGWTDQSDFPSLQVTTGNPHSGIQSAQANIDQNVLIRGLRKAGVNLNEVYVRWFTYYGPGFQWPSGGNTVDGLVFQAEDAGSSPTWVFYENGPASTGLVANVGSPITIQPGQWYCLEIHVKPGTTGVFEGWIDNVQKWNYPSATIGADTIQSIELMSSPNVDPPVQETQWLDDFVVSDQRISCTPPTLSLSAPSAGASVSNLITVAASVSDDIGVVGVQFQLDGQNLGAEVTSAPYTALWDTTAASDGSHILAAVARDAAGNRTTSLGVAVTVDNTPPTSAILFPSAGAAVSGTIVVTASPSDNFTVAGVLFQLDGQNLGAEVTAAPYTILWGTTTASGGPHILTAVARDAAGNRATSAGVAVTVDNTPPIIAIAQPFSGTTVSGTVVVSATASDQIGVVAVQFQLDLQNLGPEDTSPPYEILWDTTTTPNGPYTLEAVAWDAAGNRGIFNGAAVTVANSNPDPPPVPASQSSGGGGLSCFIATAAYGSPFAKEVMVLRQFRDRHLLNNQVGRTLVTIYYQISPPVARVIASNEALRAAIRSALGPLVWWAQMAVVSPGVAVALSTGCLLAILLLPFILLRIRSLRVRSIGHRKTRATG